MGVFQGKSYKWYPPEKKDGRLEIRALDLSGEGAYGWTCGCLTQMQVVTRKLILKNSKEDGTRWPGQSGVG